MYPFFLAAGVTLAIPVLIHLFNLRKYKTVLFPHTRFLKTIQLNSRKRSEIRYKALLAARLLFLFFLIFAFAQPFFPDKEKTAGGRQLQVIYIDNSYSMGAAMGPRRMLDIAKDAASRQVRNARPGTRFLVLTNDRPTGYHAQQMGEAYAAIQAIDISAATLSVDKIVAETEVARQNENATEAGLYYYSDFQQSAFPAPPSKGQMQHITFYGIPVQAAEAGNVYIDTAYLTTPVLQADRSNYVVVHTRNAGTAPKESLVLNLSVNGQVKSAASLSFDDSNERIDTLTFQVSGAGWQQISLALNDAVMRFDDTFRIAARCAPNLSVLALNEGQLNPYIQAAFRAYNGFRLNQADVSTAIQTDWKQYNLVILNGITRIDDAMGRKMNEALQAGQSMCVFPGRTTNIQALNEGLKQVGDIQLTAIDTAIQAASQLQQGSPLVKDLFEKIPENVQLPVANWHYVVTAGISANQRSVLSFRNGDPMLAQFTPSRGALYLSATSADLSSGNFPGSYFFTPFLYLMAMQGGGGSVYAVRAGSQEPVYITLANVSERNTLHAYAPGVDVVPQQRPNGAGLDVYVGNVLQYPGFYTLTATGADSTQVALNQDKAESQPGYRDIAALQNEWKGDNIRWKEINNSGNIAATGTGADFPLWKVCVILAIVMLGLETFLLARKQPRPA
ncbi:BatA and WFA domain-containing protein [Nemorincola caseinilytica]|uniref:BatA and WFA domain-containing protein n=1 Tax=Nemorincola caseinilytica TaxID=2054315 RepID=A0ABP8NAR4_9BACT